MAVLIGILTGLGLAVSTGPIFLTLIKTSIDQGAKRTAFFIVGVSIADTSALLATWYGLSGIELDAGSSWLSLVGGLVLIGIGISFFKPQSSPKEEESITFSQEEHGVKLFLKGLSLNLFNPIVWGFWAAMSQYARASFASSFEHLAFFISVLLTVLITDFLKAYFANKLTKILKPHHIRYMNVGIGCLLIFFGLKLFFDFFMSL